MKRSSKASFEQIELAISNSFVKNSINTAKTFRGIKFIGFIFLFVIFPSYMLI